MSVKVVDHSTGGVKIGAALHSRGIKGVLRYASAGRGSVNITPAEVEDLKAHGIAVGIVNEHAADYLLGGHAVGKQRALEAQQITRACRLPDGVVYMAGDFDATLNGPTHPGSAGETNMRKIYDALLGAAEALGQDHVGFYGSYFAIEWLTHHAPWIKYYWQTPGWSKRLLHSSADIYQGDTSSRQPTSLSIDGVSCDGNIAFSLDWGQRTSRPAIDKATGHFNANLSLRADNGHWSLRGAKSSDIHFDEEDVLYTLAIGVHLGGKNRGQWVSKPMPKNWKPPGGW